MGKTLSTLLVHSRHFLCFLILIALPRCSNSIPKLNSSYMTPVAYPGVMDNFRMEVPSGWRFLDPGEYQGMSPSYWIVRQGQNSSSFASMRVFHISPERIGAYYGTSDADGDNLKIDIKKYCSKTLLEAKKAGTLNVKNFPCRIIDKLQACGYSGYEMRENRRYFANFWFVWRHDGMWEINIYSDPDSNEIPQELLKALDTIRWERR